MCRLAGNPRQGTPKELAEETNPTILVAQGTKLVCTWLCFIFYPWLRFIFYPWLISSWVNTPKGTSQADVPVGEGTENRLVAPGQAHGGRGTHPTPPEAFGQGTCGLRGVACSQRVQRAAVSEKRKTQIQKGLQGRLQAWPRRWGCVPRHQQSLQHRTDADVAAPDPREEPARLCKATS